MQVTCVVWIANSFICSGGEISHSVKTSITALNVHNKLWVKNPGTVLVFITSFSHCVLHKVPDSQKNSMSMHSLIFQKFPWLDGC